jgi:hypothetical protein
MIPLIGIHPPPCRFAHATRGHVSIAHLGNYLGDTDNFACHLASGTSGGLIERCTSGSSGDLTGHITSGPLGGSY